MGAQLLVNRAASKKQFPISHCPPLDHVYDSPPLRFHHGLGTARPRLSRRHSAGWRWRCACASQAALAPWPELTGPVLFHETFDWASYPGLTDDEVVIANYGTLRESWTGMALQRRGTVTPFLVPALDANGHINLASHAGQTHLNFSNLLQDNECFFSN